MSHGPSTLGTMTTSRRSPISLTRRVMSSSIQGDSRAFTRVHSAVAPRSISRPTRTRPSRAASLRSIGIASSRLPSRMSVFVAMSGALATIFSLEKSRKWIIREGRTGTSVTGSGAPMARGLRKSRGLRIDLDSPVSRRKSVRSRDRRPSRLWLPTGRIHRYMTENFTTDQAAREASGAHAYGRYLEEFEVGDVYKHWPAKTVTESDDHLFCLITMNHHPLHLNDVYAAQSQQKRNVVVGPLVYSLALGMSVSDVSGKAIANLATEELSHPAPVFHGDTLFVESEVLEKRESRSKPDRGTVKVHTRVFNQDGTLVAEFKRLVLVPRKTPGSTGGNGSDEPAHTASGD